MINTKTLLTILSVSIILFASAGCKGNLPTNNHKQHDTKVTTEDAAEITTSTAKLSGSLKDAASAPRELGFEWGLTKENLSEIRQSEDIFGTGSGSFSASINNLVDEKTYFYRAYAVVMENGKGVYYYGDIKNFTTKKEEGKPDPEPGDGNQAGWFELPKMNIAKKDGYMTNASAPSEYYAYHICAGEEKGPNGQKARNYTVCYSSEHHCPVWVAAPRHKMYVGNSGRTNAYGIDAAIPADIQYKSKSTGGGCNKGHMLGSAERTSSKATNRQVFYYTNIAPQLSTGFNTGGGGWNLLEDYVDAQVCADTLYEVVGCYFKKYTDGYGNTVSPQKISFGGRNDVAMPTMFYYVLLRTKGGNSKKAVTACASDELKCVAFVRSHTNSLKGQNPSRKEMMSVSDLEKLTGMTYFANVPKAPKSTFNPSDWGL